MTTLAATSCDLPGVAFDPVCRRLEGPDGCSLLEPLVAQLLLLLSAKSGQVCERRFLFQQLWGNAQVGDDSLNRLIGALRRSLERVGAQSIKVETVPRVGYRLLAEPAAPATVTAPLPRRAVLTAGAALVTAVGATGWWTERQQSRLAQSESLTDTGNRLLRDLPPIEAGTAVTDLRSAVALAPGNARAAGLLALGTVTAASNGGSKDPGRDLATAEELVRRTLGLDAAEPHGRLALIEMSSSRLDWSGLENGLRRLFAAAPDNVHVVGELASFYQSAGRLSLAWAFNERAAALAPSSPTPLWRRVLRLWAGGQPDAALLLSERLMPLWPRHSLVWSARFMLLAFTGRMQAAAAMIADANLPQGAIPVRPDQWLPTLTAFAQPSPSNVARAREANLVAARRSPGLATFAALNLGQLGDVDGAYTVMNGLLRSSGSLVAGRPLRPGNFAANSTSWCRTHWLFLPPLAGARSDPRFQDLCRDLGLIRYWRDRSAAPDLDLPSGASD